MPKFEKSDIVYAAENSESIGVDYSGQSVRRIHELLSNISMKYHIEQVKLSAYLSFLI